MKSNQFIAVYGKKVFILATYSIISYSAFSQSVTDKVDNAALGVYKANNAVNNASNSVSNAKNTVKGVKETLSGLFGGKKKKEAEQVKTDTILAKPVVIDAGTVITIEVTNIAYANLKTLEDSIKTIPGVKATTKKFSSAASTIDVTYSGQADQLWDLMSAHLKQTLELVNLSDTKIALNTKK